MFDLPWDKPPEFVNEKGFKWWQDAETTGYAKKKNHNGKNLMLFVGLLKNQTGEEQGF